MCQRVFIQNDGKCAKLHFFAFYGDFKKCSLKLRLFLIIKFFGVHLNEMCYKMGRVRTRDFTV